MDSAEVQARLDTLEAQSSTDMSCNKGRPINSPMHLIKRGSTMLLRSLTFSQSRDQLAIPPHKEDTKSVPEILTRLQLSDLYDVPGEYVAMKPEIFSAMRSGNRKFLEKMEKEATPMACFKNEKGDSILHLAAAWGNIDLVKDILSKCPSLLLDLNWKDQLPLHVAARGGHSAVVKILVATEAYFSTKLSEEDRERLNIYVLRDTNGDTALNLAMKDLHEKAEISKNQQPTPISIIELAASTSLMDTSLKDIVAMLVNANKLASFLSNNDVISKSLMETAVILVNANEGVSFLANNDEISPLYLAAVGNELLVKAMLNFHGRTTTLASQLEGKKSIVHAALKAKNIGFLNIILDKDPSLINERDEEGRTCLSVGASVGFYEGICRLLDISTSAVYECDEDGSFPIHRAIEKGHTLVVKKILERCPDSECLVNRKGQNMLHIAAKSGKGRPFLEYYITNLDKKKNHLIEEQDVDGNTPLHLATINWHPRSVFALSMRASSCTKILNIRNNNGLRALDIAELRLQSEYVFRERLTMVVLLCVYKPEGVDMLSMTGLTLRSKSESLNANKYKDHINALLMVAALVATVTFAAGFTIPGGFNSSAPNSGMSILARDKILSVFLVFDTVAMQSSVISIVALIWAQLGDPAVVDKALILALVTLLYGLVFMSLAFVFGILATIKHNTALTVIIAILFIGFFYQMALLLYPYVIPQIPGTPTLPLIFSFFKFPLWFVSEDDDSNHFTYGSGHMCVKGDYAGSTSE